MLWHRVFLMYFMPSWAAHQGPPDILNPLLLSSTTAGFANNQSDTTVLMIGIIGGIEA